MRNPRGEIRRPPYRRPRYPTPGTTCPAPQRPITWSSTADSTATRTAATLTPTPLSLTLSVRGLPLLIDPGTGCYTSDRALRDRLRSTALHNTLTFDDRPAVGAERTVSLVACRETVGFMPGALVTASTTSTARTMVTDRSNIGAASSRLHGDLVVVGRSRQRVAPRMACTERPCIGISTRAGLSMSIPDARR